MGDLVSLYPEATDVFTQLSLPVQEVTEDQFSILQNFVVLMYDRTSGEKTVNAARKELFVKKRRSMERIPPTEDALFQHTKRASYQQVMCGALVWKKNQFGLIRLTGDGSVQVRVLYGSHCGQLFQQLQLTAKSLSVAGVKQNVQRTNGLPCTAMCTV